MFSKHLMSSRPFAPRRAAFTLVEILVVVGIILLLAAILFPVFSKVRETGRRSVCNSNMHQLGLAFQQYTQDFGGRYPYAGNYQVWAGTDAASVPTAWKGATAHWVTGGDVGGIPKNYTDAEKGLADSTKPTTPTPGKDDFKTVPGRQAYVEKGALFPYAKSASVYVCPSAPDGDVRKLSYSMNCAIAGISGVRIRNASEVVLLVDEGRSLNDGYFWASDAGGGVSTDSLFDGHNGSGNLLFADGHVKSVLSSEHPLDYSTQGIANKMLLSGDIRFRDAAFGKKGSNIAPSGTQTTCGDSLP